MLRRYIPSPPLAYVIRCLWYSEGVPGPHARERLMPTGEASIIFNLRDDDMRIYDAENPSRYVSCGLSAISGARTNCCVIDTAAEDRVAGIQFLPGGSFPFFLSPSSELENTSAPLDCLWPSAAEIREQLLDAPSVNAMFAVLERELLARVVRPLFLHPAVRYARSAICHAPQIATVSALSDAIGLSQRRFSELFRDQIGIAPKAFSRVRRFQQVLATVHQARHCSVHIDWADVALDSGYYDQAHFIHDFQAFSGLTPSAYISRATDHLNHVPVA